MKKPQKIHNCENLGVKLREFIGQTTRNSTKEKLVCFKKYSTNSVGFVDLKAFFHKIIMVHTHQYCKFSKSSKKTSIFVLEFSVDCLKFFAGSKSTVTNERWFLMIAWRSQYIQMIITFPSISAIFEQLRNYHYFTTFKFSARLEQF